MRTRLVFAYALVCLSGGILVGACTSSSETGDTADAGGGSSSGDNADAKSSSNGASGDDDDDSTDGSPSTPSQDAQAEGGDGDGGVPGPTPPVGATKCGSGTLTPADVVSACNTPITFGPAPDNGCNSTTSSGGRYEVWCSNTATYVWVEIDGLTASPGSCPVTSLLRVSGNANYSYTSTGAGVGAGPATLTPSGSYPYPIATSPSIALTASIGSTTKGSMTIWASGVDPTCVQDAAHYGALIAGAKVSW